jgi:hypothetical protein
LVQVLDAPLAVALLWGVALVVAGYLAYLRYRGATVFPADFGIFFEAGRAVAAGHNPYSVRGYVYPPTLAVLLAPFSHLRELSVFRAWLSLSIICVGLTAAIVVWLEARWLRRWQCPILFGFCAVTAFHFWPLVIELPDGQSDVFTLAFLAVAYLALTREKAMASGIMIGMAGILKGWPALMAVVFLRRGQPRRSLSLVAFAVVLLTAPVVAAFVGGVSGPTSMVSAIVGARSQPRLASYSVWGIPRLTFSDTPIGRPVVVSPILAIISTVVLLGWVVALLVVTLRQDHPEPGIPFWNVAFCVILLLPVSHLSYTIYVLPVLWLWSVRAVRSSRINSAESLVFATLFLWWIVVSQSRLGQDTSQLSATVVFFVNLAACSTSVIGLAWMDGVGSRAPLSEARESPGL